MSSDSRNVSGMLLMLLFFACFAGAVLSDTEVCHGDSCTDTGEELAALQLAVPESRVWPSAAPKIPPTPFFTPPFAGTTLEPEEAITYDVIIVGAGLVGSVLAKKLQELFPKKSIAVLEAGPPGQWPRGKTQPGNWNFASDALQPWPGNWHGMTLFDVPGTYNHMHSYQPGKGPVWDADAVANQYQAKVVGGGGSINGALTQEPSAGMFAGGPEPGWPTWPAPWRADTMQRFIDLAKTHLTITPTPSTDGKHYLDEAGADQLFSILGAPAPCASNTDTNNPCAAYPDGMTRTVPYKPENGMMGYPTVSSENGIRQSTATVFLASAAARANFSLMESHEVTEIVHANGKATAVKYRHDRPGLPSKEGRLNLSSKGLVVLSGGGFGSPRMLLQNRIGDLEFVGRNLSDHAMTSQIYKYPVNNIRAVANLLRDLESGNGASVALRSQMVLSLTGPLTQYGPIAVAFIKDPTTPESYKTDVGGEYDVEVFVNPSEDGDSIKVWYVLMRPTCSSADLHWSPTEHKLTIKNNNLYLACERDIQTMQYAHDVVQSRMIAAGVMCVEDNDNTCGKITSNTRTYSINHWAGSCALDKVVDPTTLRVHGSENVAVADASIMPGQVWGHPALTLTALGLHAADLIAKTMVDS